MFLRSKSFFLLAASLAFLPSCKKEGVTGQQQTMPALPDSLLAIHSARYDIGIAAAPFTVNYVHENGQIKALDGADIRWDFVWDSGRLSYRKQANKRAQNEKKADSLFYTAEGRLSRAECYQTWSDGSIGHSTRKFGYNQQGQLTSIELFGNFQHAWKMLDKWNFTYENGNIISASYTLLAYGDSTLTTDYTFSYDNKANVFSKAPLQSFLTNLLSSDFNGAEVAFFFSKNNVVSTKSGHGEGGFRYELDNRARLSIMQREGAGPFIEFFYLKN